MGGGVRVSRSGVAGAVGAVIRGGPGNQDEMRKCGAHLKKAAESFPSYENISRNERETPSFFCVCQIPKGGTGDSKQGGKTALVRRRSADFTGFSRTESERKLNLTL